MGSPTRKFSVCLTILVAAAALGSPALAADRVRLLPGAPIYLSDAEPEPVRRADRDLQRDLRAVLGKGSPWSAGWLPVVRASWSSEPLPISQRSAIRPFPDASPAPFSLAGLTWCSRAPIPGRHLRHLHILLAVCRRAAPVVLDLWKPAAKPGRVDPSGRAPMVPSALGTLARLVSARPGSAGAVEGPIAGKLRGGCLNHAAPEDEHPRRRNDGPRQL
jgi:hypothetical protein